MRPFEEFVERPELGAKTAASFLDKSQGQAAASSSASSSSAGRPIRRSREDDEDDDEVVDDDERASPKSTESMAKRSKVFSDDSMRPAADLAAARSGADDHRIIFFERSVLSDRYCFAANCRSSGLFEEVEWRVYCDWWRWIISEFRVRLMSVIRIGGWVYPPQVTQMTD